MVVITKGAIHDFARKHPKSAGPLNDWFDKAAAASWKSFQDVKQTFNTVDSIGEDRYVFDIGGNNFRLIARGLIRGKLKKWRKFVATFV